MRSIHSATKHRGFRTHPLAQKGLIQSFRESVQRSPGKCGQRTTGLCPVGMEEGGSKRRKRDVSWRRNLCRRPGDDTAAPSPQTLPALISSLEASSRIPSAPGGAATRGKEKPWRHSCDQIRGFLSPAQLSLGANSPYSFSLYFSPQNCPHVLVLSHEPKE